MSYASQTDLEELLPGDVLIRLTDDDNLGVVDTGRVENAITRASVTIDGYLAGRYPLPFANVPPILTSICVDLAGHLLHVRRDMISEHWKQQSENAIHFLEKLSRGQLTLGLADPVGTGDKETLQVSAPDALFGSDEMDKY